MKILALASTLALLGASAYAQTENYPSRPIRLIVPSAPGGGGDVVARIWADCAGPKFGQPVVVENRGGANGVPGVQQLKQAPSDGYTLFIAGMSQLTITPYIFSKPPYDVAKDFVGASLLVSSPYILTAGPGSKINKFEDIAKQSADRPNGLDFGSPGNGSPAHLMSAILADRLKTRFVHVPFQGEGAALTSMMGDQIQIAPFIAGTAMAQIKAGKVKPLVVLGEKRLSELPQVPTIAEVAGMPELSHGSWTAVVARSGTPAPVLERIHAVTQQCLSSPETIKRYQAMNAELILAGINATQEYVRRDTSLWKPLVEKLGVKND